MAEIEYEHGPRSSTRRLGSRVCTRRKLFIWALSISSSAEPFQGLGELSVLRTSGHKLVNALTLVESMPRTRTRHSSRLLTDIDIAYKWPSWLALKTDRLGQSEDGRDSQTLAGLARHSEYLLNFPLQNASASAPLTKPSKSADRATASAGSHLAVQCGTSSQPACPAGFFARPLLSCKPAAQE